MGRAMALRGSPRAARSSSALTPSGRRPSSPTMRSLIAPSCEALRRMRQRNYWAALMVQEGEAEVM